MINFAELKPRVNTKYSFVGIEKKRGKLIFHLPKGFTQDDPNINKFDFKCELFFKLYKVLKIVQNIYQEKGYLQKNIKINDRDGVLKQEAGKEVIINDNQESIFYSKLDALDNILDVYDELKILALVSRLSKSETIDYSKIHRYLHKSTFLNNGAIFIDSIDIPRQQISYEASDIVAMYCYIFTEIKQKLGENVNPEIAALSARFRQKYIGYEYSLFSEDHYSLIINTLRDALETIDNYTALKDIDYWDFYDAVEKFLFGELDDVENGKIWGFNNFHSVWEGMCLTYLLRYTNPCFVCYLNSRYIASEIIAHLNYKNRIIDLSKIFHVNGKDIFPDAVIISFNTKNNRSNSTLPNLIPSTNSYKIEKIKNWNDLQYYTTFKCNKYQLKIALIHQNPELENHTFNELAKFCKLEGDTLIVNSLPNQFYSYWEILDDFSLEQLQMMKNLNHIFYLALKFGILSADRFFQRFIDYVLGSEYLLKDNIFYLSLFRDKDRLRSLKEINQSFSNFLNKIMNKISIKAIDIKYANFDYYLNPGNREEVKSRSVRKQFVYEYLIQNYLENYQSTVKNWSINSEFWLPTYRKNLPVLTPGTKYMDDYVKLMGVNIVKVIDSYIALRARE
ncbi:MAG: hypothetical protein F6K23_08165 [Okeania sp. SIO2C9]|uniref:hypothetical protein n=1 Tax=Okeania sp. SIO2C9 TaxID=2607791 RepID=UPI0013C1DDF2|nr:hypothetical protein [Okeania sp. SIO2C9]NEQ73052.1 hypothetical protein [Okeania sp. SIO2C9]